MYILNIARAMKKCLSVRSETLFVFENYYKRIGFSKENSLYSMKYLKEKYLLLLANKLLEKITNPRNAKEHYQSFIRNKNTNSIITEYPKTSYKLS